MAVSGSVIRNQREYVKNVLKWILLPAIAQIITLYLAGIGSVLAYFWVAPIVLYVYWKAKPRVEVHSVKLVTPERMAVLIQELKGVETKRENE
jgi:hypothetical protein